MQMAADCKKMSKQCANEEKTRMPLAVNKISDKALVNKMEVMPAQDGHGIKEERKQFNESFLGMENDCMVAALNPVGEIKLKKHEK